MSEYIRVSEAAVRRFGTLIALGGGGEGGTGVVRDDWAVVRISDLVC